MSRVSKFIRNAKVSIFFYLITTLTAFFTRKIFLEHLGDDFIGLTGTLRSILGFLNLAELGIGTAISFALYKPLYQNNKQEIKKLVYLIGYLYRRLGLLILFLGVILSLFFPLIFDEVPFNLPLVYYGFYCYLIASLCGFFINYNQILLNADQKGYIIASYYQSANILRQLIQAIIAIYLESYFLWLSMELISSLVYSICIRRKTLKLYSFTTQHTVVENNIFEAYPIVIKKIKQVFVHKISSFVTSGTDQILIFLLVNLKSVAFFGNYNLIFSQVAVFVNNLFSGMGAGIGNLVAENNPKQISKVFWEMMALRVYLTTIIIFNLVLITNPFISLWLGSNYILDDTILYLMLFNLGMKIIRLPIDNYITAYGLYQDTWAPIAQTVINLFVSIFYGLKMGIAGIMLGTSISMFTIIFIWKPHFLYREGFKKNVYSSFWPTFLKMLTTGLVSFYLSYYSLAFFNQNESNSFYLLIILLLKVNFVIITISSLLFYLNKGFRDFIKRLPNIIKFK